METATESLISLLANGQVGMDILLTEAQETLGVSRELVYICGLVTGGKPPPFTSHQTKMFTHLQNLYNESLDDTQKPQLKLFRLTPALAPKKEAQEVIDKDLARKTEELELQSRKVLQELLSEENDLSAPSTRKKGSTARRKQQTSSHRPQTEVQSEKDPDEKGVSLSSTSLQQILAEKKVLQETEDMQNEATEDSWTQVRKKKTHQHPQQDADSPEPQGPLPSAFPESSACEAHNVTSDAIKERQEEKGAAVKSSVLSADEEDDVSPTNLTLEDSPATATKPPPVLASLLITNEREINEDSVNTLEEKVRQLELQLIEKDRKLEEVQASHKKAMQAERERTEERIQALQLRLYISETRLKTFEDALAQHVEAVASNVSTAPSTPDRGSAQGGPASSRLFSRVAQP